MGRFVYKDPVDSVRIDDRILAHIRLVMMTKLRRGEGFLFDLDMDGGTRRSYWIGPGMPIHFAFDSPFRQRLNPAWIDALSRSANSADGLQIMPEPEVRTSAPRA